MRGIFGAAVGSLCLIAGAWDASIGDAWGAYGFGILGAVNLIAALSLWLAHPHTPGIPQ